MRERIVLLGHVLENGLKRSGEFSGHLGNGLSVLAHPRGLFGERNGGLVTVEMEETRCRATNSEPGAKLQLMAREAIAELRARLVESIARLDELALVDDDYDTGDPD